MESQRAIDNGYQLIKKIFSAALCRIFLYPVTFIEVQLRKFVRAQHTGNSKHFRTCSLIWLHLGTITILSLCGFIYCHFLKGLHVVIASVHRFGDRANTQDKWWPHKRKRNNRTVPACAEIMQDVTGITQESKIKIWR